MQNFLVLVVGFSHTSLVTVPSFSVIVSSPFLPFHFPSFPIGNTFLAFAMLLLHPRYMTL